MIFNYLLDNINKKGAIHVVLIDPDYKDEDSIIKRVEKANESNVDVLFVGGSLIMDSKCSERVQLIKSISNIPVILFPGGISQLNPYYDAMLFMSVISGRNPHYLIGEQVLAAPLVKDMGMETIPTAYILMDGGAGSTVEIITGTRPIPMQRVEIAISHALAGQYLGMKLVYLEAGSGAKYPVNYSVIEGVKQAVDIPIIVGGGINNPKVAEKVVLSGASIVVTGTAFEKSTTLMKEIADAVHKSSTK